MHSIEPYYQWRHFYVASEDPRSPFYGREYSEFEFTNAIYNYLIHPQWDDFGSATLYIKILFCDYTEGYCVIEMLGEWNDLLYNDIMFFKRNIVETLLENGIDKFILIGENVMNFHSSDNDYYQEWQEEAEDGWIACINFRPHVIEEFAKGHLHWFLIFNQRLSSFEWQALDPPQLFYAVSSLLQKRLNS